MSEQEKKSRELPRWAQIALLGVVGLVVVVGLVLAFRPSPVEVDLGTVDRATMRVTVEEDGRARLQDRYVVSAPVSGTLTRVQWRPGDQVEAGQELTRLRSQPSPLLDDRSQAQARTRLEAARAQLERARAMEEVAEAGLVDAREELRRQEVLMDQAGGSASAVERARAGLRAREAEHRSARFGVQVAEQEVENARLLLQRDGGGAEADVVPILSPVQGRVLRVMQESEAVVQPGAPLLEVGDVGNLELVVDLLSADAVRVRPGAVAEIERWGGDRVLAARVRTVEPSAFTRVSALGIEEQRVNVILDLTDDRQEWASLGDGYRVEARIVVWEEENTVVAPASAVFRHDGAWFAFRVEGGRAQRVSVEVGERSDVEAQILSGLEPGDRVILYPGDRVTDGDRVEER